jgi:hypothetical protein
VDNPKGSTKISTVAAAISSTVDSIFVRSFLCGAGRRWQQLFCGEDDFFLWAAGASGQKFCILLELRVTRSISARRLNQDYFIRSIQVHAFSNGVLDFSREGTRHPRFGPLQYLRMLLHGMRNGLFAMRCQCAVSRGRSDATRFILERQLRPLNILTSG